MKWAILTLISIFICVCCGQMLEWDSQGNLIAHSFSIWGDWSAHFTFISNLLNRGIHWISGDNPVFHGVPFQYPFLSHVFTAILAWVTRMDIVHVTYYSSLALLFMLPFVLFHFFRSIDLTIRQSLLAIVLFLFLGGFQAFDSSLNLNEPFTNQFQSGSVFTQIVLFEFFPQRAFLFGITVLLAGLTFAWNKLKLNQFSKSHFIGLAIYFSLLTWIHLHSWIALGIILLIYYLFNRSSKVLLFGVVVIAASTPLLYFLIFKNAHQNGWQMWYPGWAQNPASGLSGAQEMNPFYFWIYNTGIFLPLAILGIFRSRLFVLATTGICLFLLAEFINFQPYFYDNLKIFTYAFLLLSPLAAVGLDSFFQKKHLIPIALLLLIAQTHTATQDYLFFKDQKQTTSFFTQEEFDLAEQFRSLRRSPDSLVLITPKHNHWIPALAGNPVFMGYPGWLWSWGISYSVREAEVNQIFMGGPQTAEILSKYPIEYIVVNDREMVSGRFPVSLSFFRSHYPLLLERGAWHVFKLR